MGILIPLMGTRRRRGDLLMFVNEWMNEWVCVLVLNRAKGKVNWLQKIDLDFMTSEQQHTRIWIQSQIPDRIQVSQLNSFSTSIGGRRIGGGWRSVLSWACHIPLILLVSLLQVDYYWLLFSDYKWDNDVDYFMTTHLFTIHPATPPPDTAYLSSFSVNICNNHQIYLFIELLSHNSAHAFTEQLAALRITYWQLRFSIWITKYFGIFYYQWRIIVS